MILSYIRTVILYLILITVIRLMGKRQIGQMEASEFVVTMLVANLASIPMQDSAIPLFSGLIPILTVLAVELVLSSICVKNLKFRRILCGKPVILIENGRILQNNLSRTRVTLDELTGLLRQKDILDLQTVQYAILETNGNLSVFPFPQEAPPSARELGIQLREKYLPITIISDGRLLYSNLAIAGKTTQWVQQTLAQYQCAPEDTFLLTVDKQDQVIFYRKE